MKYIVFWEFDIDKTDAAIAKNVEYAKIVKESPEMFQSYIFPPHYMGEGKGFSVVEITDPAQWVNTNAFWHGVLKLKHVPIIEAANWIEAYQKAHT